MWEEAKLHEQANAYVDTCCELCSLLWYSLIKRKNLPKAAMKGIWQKLVCSCYMAMLNGFARVPYCSTEGRALMSMDLATLTSGISPMAIVDRLIENHGDDDVRPPPQISVPRGMAYADTFIKVFYFPPLDAYSWIEENHKEYHCMHSIALMAGTANFSDGNNGNISATRMIRKVKQLYGYEKTSEVFV